MAGVQVASVAEDTRPSSRNDSRHFAPHSSRPQRAGEFCEPPGPCTGLRTPTSLPIPSSDQSHVGSHRGGEPEERRTFSHTPGDPLPYTRGRGPSMYSRGRLITMLLGAKLAGETQIGKGQERPQLPSQSPPLPGATQGTEGAT